MAAAVAAAVSMAFPSDPNRQMHAPTVQLAASMEVVPPATVQLAAAVVLPAAVVLVASLVAAEVLSAAVVILVLEANKAMDAPQAPNRSGPPKRLGHATIPRAKTPDRARRRTCLRSWAKM